MSSFLDWRLLLVVGSVGGFKYVFIFTPIPSFFSKSQMLNVWSIYLHLGSLGGFHVGKYTSPIEHLGIVFFQFDDCTKYFSNGLGVETVFLIKGISRYS